MIFAAGIYLLQCLLVTCSDYTSYPFKAAMVSDWLEKVSFHMTVVEHAGHLNSL